MLLAVLNRCHVKVEANYFFYRFLRSGYVTLHFYNHSYCFIHKKRLTVSYSCCYTPLWSRYWALTLIRYSAHNGDLQTRNFTQDWLNSYWLLLLALSCFLYTHTFSLQNVLRVEASWSRILRNSIATACLSLFPTCLVLLVYLERVRCIS